MSALTIDVPREVADDVIATRRDLHAHPELGFEEHRTAAIVAERLRGLGLEVHEGIGQTGVVGVLRGARPGRTIMLRADMDGLPIDEENTVAYRSETPVQPLIPGEPPERSSPLFPRGKALLPGDIFRAACGTPG